MDDRYGYFDGLADDALPEQLEGTHFGVTKKQWLTDPQVRGAPLDDHHSHYRVGHIVEPKVCASVDDPTVDMLAFRGALNLSDPLGRSYHERIQRGDPTVQFSIEYTQDIQVTPLGKRVTGTTVNGISFHHQPRNPRCKVTVRQGDDPSKVTYTITARVLPTKAEPTSLLRFPIQVSSSTNMSSAATPAAPAPTPVATPTPAPVASSPIPTPTAPMDTDNEATTMAVNIAKMTPEELRSQAIKNYALEQQLMQLTKFKQDAEARDAIRLKTEQEKAQKDAEDRWKQTHDKYKDSVFADLGLADLSKADPQKLATLRYLATDPAATESKASEIMIGAFELAAQERGKRQALERQLAESQAIADSLKKIKTGAVPQFASKPDVSMNHLATIASDSKKAQSTTGSMTILHPATQLSLPRISVATGGHKTLTMMTPGSGSAGSSSDPLAGITQQITVAQGAGNGPSTGSPISEAVKTSAPEDQKARDVSNAFSANDIRYVVTPTGRTVDITQLYQDQNRFFPNVYPVDQQAMANVALNQGLGRMYKTSNYLEVFDPRLVRQDAPKRRQPEPNV